MTFIQVIKQKINEIICSIVGHDYQTLATKGRKYHITVCRRCGNRWYRIRRSDKYDWSR